MIFIETQQALEDLVESLSEAPWISIDTEADSLHSYFDKVCLAQLSAPSGDWILDPLKGVNLTALAPLLEDRSIRKFLHGGDYDIRILDRDYGIRLHEITDTMILAQLCGEPAIGLASLLGKYLGVELDKRFQRADWSKRPLSPEMAKYAMEDTRHLAKLVNILEEKLERLGRTEWAREEMQRLELIRHQEGEQEAPWRRIKGAGKLDPRGLAILENLADWRDSEARRRDVPPFKIMSNEMLKTIAEVKPRTAGYLTEKTRIPERLARRYRQPILDSVHRALNRDESKLPEYKKRDPWRPDRRTERLVKKLQTKRNALAAELEIEPGILLPRHAMEAIVKSNATSIDELERIDTLRKWQLELLADELISTLD